MVALSVRAGAVAAVASTEAASESELLRLLDAALRSAAPLGKTCAADVARLRAASPTLKRLRAEVGRPVLFCTHSFDALSPLSTPDALSGVIEDFAHLLLSTV